MTDRPVAVCISGATGWTGRALVPAILDAPDLELVSASGSVGRRAGSRRASRRRRDRCSGPRFRAGRAKGRRRPRRLHVSHGGEAEHARRDRGGRRRCDRHLRSHRRGLRGDRRGGAQARPRRRCLRQLLADRCDVPGGSLARGAPSAAVGDHRLRERDEARRPERDGARARRASSERSVAPKSAIRSRTCRVRGRPAARRSPDRRFTPCVSRASWFPPRSCSGSRTSG